MRVGDVELKLLSPPIHAVSQERRATKLIYVSKVNIGKRHGVRHAKGRKRENLLPSDLKLDATAAAPSSDAPDARHNFELNGQHRYIRRK